MDPIAFQLGSFPIRWYGILMSLAMAAGLIFAYRESESRGIDSDHLLNLIIFCIPAAIIGARLYYVLFSGSLDFYLSNPSEILATWHGGLAFHGGLIGGIVVGYFYIRKHKLNFWSMADLVAPGIALGQAIGRWGNFFNQEAHGGPVSYDFISRFPQFIQQGMYIKGQYYHPTFLYESVWDFLIFVALAALGRKSFFRTGDVFLVYIVFYSLGRFLIEGLRTDSLMLGPFRIAQLVSLAGILVASALIYRNHRVKDLQQ